MLTEAYQLAGVAQPRFNVQDSKPRHPTKVIDIMTKGMGDFEPALNFNLISSAFSRQLLPAQDFLRRQDRRQQTGFRQKHTAKSDQPDLF